MHVSIPILVIAGMLWATLTHALAIHSALVKANFTLPVGYVIDPNISPAVVTGRHARRLFGISYQSSFTMCLVKY